MTSLGLLPLQKITTLSFELLDFCFILLEVALLHQVNEELAIEVVYFV